MTNKTELAVFLVMVVKEMEVGTVDMWSSSLTIEDRLTALRLNECCLFAKLNSNFNLNLNLN